MRPPAHGAEGIIILATTAEVGYDYDTYDDSMDGSSWQLHSRAMGGQVLPQAGVWLHADSIPELRQTRLAADEESAAVYERHMVNLRQGETQYVPLDSDSISAAARALAVRQQFGEKSAEYAEARLGVQVNFQRYLSETWSKLGPEYFRPLKQTYDREADDYLSYGFPITPMMHRGITPLAEPQEVPRRFMENRENATNNQVGRLVMRAAGVLMDEDIPEVALPLELRQGSVSVQTVSGCPKHIIKRYEQDRMLGLKRQYGGYAPQIKKRMVRSTSFDPLTGDRYVEQASVSGEFIDDEVVWAYNERKGVVAEGARPDVTEVLGIQVLTDSTEGVLGMLQELDAIASERHGKNIFLGRVVTADHPKDYQAFPAEAAAREQQQMLDADELAEYALQLAEADIEHAHGNVMIDDMVAKQMFERAKSDEQFAEVAFDHETAVGLREAREARLRGDVETARRIEVLTEKSAPPPEGCSGGACEVRSVDRDSDEGVVLAKLLNARPGDKIAVDESRLKHRRCKCGGQLAFAYGSDRYTSGCMQCKTVKTVISSSKDKDV